MDSLKIYLQKDILALVNLRAGEEKLGEKVQVVPALDKLATVSARFVLLGIPEDIGVRANYGVAGARTAWITALKALLNIQSNPFLNGSEILVLGHFEIEEPFDTSMHGLRSKVNQIDSLVAPVIQMIVAAGKIPIVIGGGHNNAYPIIIGAAHALNQKINVLNIDAHADLRDPKEGRHSGNGFSYALAYGHLNHYGVFGLHQNYLNQNFTDHALAHQIGTVYFDDLLMSEKSIQQHWLDFAHDVAEPCGLEIDLDSIENALSSAITPSGFALNDIRKILLSGNKTYTYLHLCEGAAKLIDGRETPTIGKLIAYLISDFIKALPPRIDQQL